MARIFSFLLEITKRFKHIIHQFDPWHIAKNINKKLIKAAKKKANNALGPWIPHVINHLYWSIQTCKKNPEELRERFTSTIYHVVNRHTFTGNKFYKKCDHEPYSKKEGDNRKWLKLGSPAHEALKAVILDLKLVKDIGRMNENIFTTYLEVFHSLKIRYLPKSTFFG